MPVKLWTVFHHARYCASVYELFKHGGGKALNHFYIGPPNSGKTALTRPVLELFGESAFVKPQVGTSFALAGIIGAKALIWNDFYWPHPPLSWGDLLNVLDNEPFGVGLPKGDGEQDYQWNRNGEENVVAFLTSNSPVVYIADKAVDEVKTKAWNDRFGENVYTFTVPLPSPDRRFKVWLRCKCCYSKWILANAGREAIRCACTAVLEGASTPTTPRAKVSTASSSQTEDQGTRSRSRGRASATAVSSTLPDVPPMPTQASSATILPMPQVCLPVRATEEPLRALNLFAQRNGGEVPSFNMCVEDDSTGLWHCEARWRGVSARGSGRGKKEAKREAAKELLEALRQLAPPGA